MPRKLKPTARLRAAKITLRKLIKAARAAGVHVEIGLSPHASDMSLRYPSDPAYILALIEESERVNLFGNRWNKAKIPNPLAAEACFRMGWGYALAAAWLRGQLHGPEAGIIRTKSPWIDELVLQYEEAKAKKKK